MDVTGIYEYCKDNILGLLAIIVPTIVAVLIFIFQKRKKKINLYVIYNGKIINSNNSIVNKKLSIKFGDREIKDLGLLIFEIKNTGNVVIDKNDFIENKDLVIEFNGGELLVSNLKETTPDYLKEDVSYSISQNKLLIEPFTINTGDSLIFEILANGDIEKILPKPRIKGIKELKMVSFNFSKIRYFLFIIVLTNLLLFVKNYDKAIFDNKTIYEIFKTSETIHNDILRIIYYILPLLILYYFYKFIKIEIIADKLRGKVKGGSFIKPLISKFIK